MINKRNTRISLVTLILCLCLGSLVVLPFTQITPYISEIAVDTENYNLFDQAEFDDDFFVISIIGVILAGLNFLMFKPINLDFKSASLSPVSPPPKSS